MVALLAMAGCNGNTSTANPGSSGSSAPSPTLIGLPSLHVITPAPSVGPVTATFTATGSMTTPRETQSAVLLNDGRVLIAGGYADPGTTQGTAELYNPATGTFDKTGLMTVPRQENTATVMANGLVLLTGGENPSSGASGGINSAELYDPTIGRFRATGNMVQPRRNSTATRLNDGRVLIAGGGNTTSNLGTAELYDPSTGVFTATGPMVAGRSGATATLLPNGRVLIAGGADATGVPVASAELYDPSTDRFTATGSMATIRMYFTATLVSGGRVLVVGGDASTGPGQNQGVILSSAEIYDPATGLFTQTGSMGTLRSNHAATLLLDGRVLVAGGENITSGSGLASAEVYDPASGQFSPTTGSMTHPRFAHSATLLANGRVLIVGGFGDSASPSSAELCQI